MDNEALNKRIEQLEDQVDSLKKAISKQNTLVNEVGGKTEKYLDIAREQSSEIARLNSQLSSLAQFDTALSKLRIEMSKQIAESEKRTMLEIKMQDNLRDNVINSFDQSINSVKKDFAEEFDKKMKGFLEENSRWVQRFKEIDAYMEEKISGDEENKANWNLLQLEFRQNKKIIENLTTDFEVYKTRLDDMRSKMEIVINEIRAGENRTSEIIASETERRSAFVTFMEQQTVTKKDQEKKWGEWQSQFDASINTINNLLPELQNQQFEMNKTKAAFDEISQKFERRANELTEMYRLMDEKFRKEWDTYKSDSEKRWANLSLTTEDRQGGFTEQFEKIRNRILVVEDSTNDMQEALLLMSREIQKGMHSLMNMVNNWMDAFTMIKPEK